MTWSNEQLGNSVPPAFNFKKRYISRVSAISGYSAISWVRSYLDSRKKSSNLLIKMNVIQ